MTRPIFLVQNSEVPQNRPSFSKIAFSVIFWLLRIGILSVSLSAIAGSVLTTLNPTSIPFLSSLTKSPTPVKTEPNKPSIVKNPVAKPPTTFQLKQEVLPLKQEILALAKKSPQLKPFALFVDLDNGNYVDVDSTKPLSAASTIKIPVLVAFFQDVDAGKISLDQSLTLTKEDIGDGSGVMQYQKPGTIFTALEVVTKMIIISDNTATNMLIKLLGGKDALNHRITSWGLTATSIKNPLPDLKGTNTTSAKDLAYLLFKINQGELVSLKSRDRMLGIMQKTETRTLLPQGLEKGDKIADKTGDIGTILGDAGIIEMVNGKRYIGVTFVQRPYNDVGGRILIQQISKTVRQAFKNPPTVAKKPEADG